MKLEMCNLAYYYRPQSYLGISYFKIHINGDGTKFLLYEYVPQLPYVGTTF
jgi:hypothetical protein